MLDAPGVYKMLYSASSLLGAAHPRVVEMRRALPVVSPESRVGSRVSGRISCLYLTYDPPELRVRSGRRDKFVDGGRRKLSPVWTARVSRDGFGSSSDEKLDAALKRATTTSDAPNGGSRLYSARRTWRSYWTARGVPSGRGRNGNGRPDARSEKTRTLTTHGSSTSQPFMALHSDHCIFPLAPWCR